MADLIDRQTIIETIHSAIYPYFCGAEDGDALSDDEKLVLSVNKAVCTAIKALPSAQPDVPDTTFGNMISRQSAIEACLRYNGVGWVWSQILDEIKQLPSVEAEPVRHGHWINHPDDLFPADSMIECSVCHEYEYATANDNFCGNCGAKMDEVE